VAGNRAYGVRYLISLTLGHQAQLQFTSSSPSHFLCLLPTSPTTTQLSLVRKLEPGQAISALLSLSQRPALWSCPVVLTSCLSLFLPHLPLILITRLSLPNGFQDSLLPSPNPNIFLVSTAKRMSSRKRKRSDSLKLIYGKMPDEVIFDSRGDLRLIVGGTYSFTVYSRVLARASTVFDTMLYGGGPEAKPAQGDWVVRLPGDRAYGLHILLDIIHGNIHRIENNIFKHTEDERDDNAALELLSAVAIMADKYDMLVVFSPWAESWLKSGKFRHRDILADKHWHSDLLRAAWVFGDETVTLHELHRLVVSISIRESWAGRVLRFAHPRGHQSLFSDDDRHILSDIGFGKCDLQC